MAKRILPLALVVATVTLGLQARAATAPPTTVRHDVQVAVPHGSGVRLAWDGGQLTAGPIGAPEVSALMSGGSSAPGPVAACWNALWFTVADLPLGPANVAAPLGGAPGTCRTAPASTHQSFTPTRHGPNAVGVPSWEFVTIGAASGFLTPATAGGEAFAGDFAGSSFSVKCIAESPGVSNVATGVGTVPLIYNCTVQVVGNPLTWDEFGGRVVNYQSAGGNPGGLGVTGFVLHGV